MYEELRALFGKENPSVNKFETILSDLPPVRRFYYYRLAYKVALCEWEYLTVRYQIFLTRLFTRNWQRTLDHLLENTVLGTLQFDRRSSCALSARWKAASLTTNPLLCIWLSLSSWPSVIITLWSLSVTNCVRGLLHPKTFGC